MGYFTHKEINNKEWLNTLYNQLMVRMQKKVLAQMGRSFYIVHIIILHVGLIIKPCQFIFCYFAFKHYLLVGSNEEPPENFRLDFQFEIY